MFDTNDTMIRKVLGPSLQVGALRAIALLAGFAAIGALLAWAVR